MISNKLETGEYTINTPDGFIGLPWDALHELQDIMIDEFYHITFVGGVKLIFDKKNQFHFFKNSFFYHCPPFFKN